MLKSLQGASSTGALACIQRLAPIRVGHVSRRQECTPLINTVQLTYSTGVQTAACRVPQLRKARLGLTRATAAAQPAQESNSWDAVFSGQALPAPYTSPSLEVRDVPGKGRGLFAAQPISAGDLLLVVRPLVYLEGESGGDMPNVEQLLAKLNSTSFSEDQLAWVRALHAGDPELEGQPSRPVPPLTPQQQPQQQGGRKLGESDLEEALRMNVLALNMYGEESHDLPASGARGNMATLPHLGLWPQFALLNHSCAPNAINYTIGDHMIVRAAQDIPQGTEVAINYLGRNSLRPATERLLDLRDGYGFACSCLRCAAEMDPANEQAVQLMQGVYDAVMMDMVPGLQAALGDSVNPGDTSGVRLVQSTRKRLAPLITTLEQQLEKVQAHQSSTSSGSGPPLRSWLRASSFEGFALQAQLESVEAQLLAAAGEPAPQSAGSEASQRMLSIASEVASGSDLHMFLAVKSLVNAQAAGASAAEVAEKERGVRRVLELRYGRGLQPDTMSRLQASAIAALERVAL